MGKKAKNAGKKASKTCDRPATEKSVHCKKGVIKKVEVKNVSHKNGRFIFNGPYASIDKMVLGRG